MAKISLKVTSFWCFLSFSQKKIAQICEISPQHPKTNPKKKKKKKTTDSNAIPFRQTG
jgi:hypothetical protein